MPADSIEVPALASAITRLANWGDFSACAESQEHALAEIQKALAGSQLHGHLGCSAGMLSRRDSPWAWNLAATVQTRYWRFTSFQDQPGRLCTGDMQIR
jgi:hypothetical protein